MPAVPPGGRMTGLGAVAQSGTFGSTPFGPGAPLDPQNGNQPVRAFDFASGHNLNSRPRSREAFGFADLRAFANVELVRLAIETRKDQIERLDWRVRPKLDRRGRTRPEKAGTGAYPAQLARIRQIEAFLRKPDGVTLFGPWMRKLVEDLLVLDAPALEPRRDRAGRLIGLDVVPGDTINVLVDATGRRPRPPLPAYQQVLRGGTIQANLTSAELLYLPRNVRPGHVYGYSPTEQIIVTINTALRRQAAQLAHFSASNTPDGIINAPDGWTAEQLKAYQEWFDNRLRGQQDQRAGVLWVPFGARYQPFKDAPLKDEFDEWLARVVCFAFSLPPTPFIKQMNRSTSENDAERSLTEGMEPLLVWAKRFLDDVIQSEFDPDLEFVWDPPRDIDPKIQSEIDDRYVRNGIKCVDEIREDLGMEPIQGGDVARIYLAEGPVRLDLLDDHADARLQVMLRDDAKPAGEKPPARRSGGSSHNGRGVATGQEGAAKADA